MRWSNSALQQACSCWAPARRATTIHRPCPSMARGSISIGTKLTSCEGAAAGGRTLSGRTFDLANHWTSICACAVTHPLCTYMRIHVHVLYLHVDLWVSKTRAIRLQFERELFLRCFLITENFNLYSYKVATSSELWTKTGHFVQILLPPLEVIIFQRQWQYTIYLLF